jgi:threonine/homoserine/homoserine lactone efflux protein
MLAGLALLAWLAWRAVTPADDQVAAAASPSAVPILSGS